MHDKAMELFEDMQRNGCTPCITPYNIMINSIMVAREMAKAGGVVAHAD